MTEFTREMKISPGYDHRDEPGAHRGAHGCDLWLALRGPDGAIAARISTGWMSNPLAGRLIPGAGEQRRRGKPGLDFGSADSYPSGGFVGAHSLELREGFSPDAEACGWIDGAPCYIQGGFLIADEILKLLTTGGSDAAFERLGELYQAWIVDAPLVADGGDNDA